VFENLPTPQPIPRESLAVWGFFFLSFLILNPINMRLSLQEIPIFLRRYSIVTPYQLHIKSIVSME
jgi:hypothetical protein